MYYRDREIRHFNKVLRTRKLARAIELIGNVHWTRYNDWPVEHLQEMAQHVARLYEASDLYNLLHLEEVLWYLSLYRVDVTVSEAVQKKSLNARLQQRLS